MESLSDSKALLACPGIQYPSNRHQQVRGRYLKLVAHVRQSRYHVWKSQRDADYSPIVLSIGQLEAPALKSMSLPLVLDTSRVERAMSTEPSTEAYSHLKVHDQP